MAKMACDKASTIERLESSVQEIKQKIFNGFGESIENTKNEIAETKATVGKLFDKFDQFAMESATDRTEMRSSISALAKNVDKMMEPKTRKFEIKRWVGTILIVGTFSVVAMFALVISVASGIIQAEDLANFFGVLLGHFAGGG